MNTPPCCCATNAIRVAEVGSSATITVETNRLQLRPAVEADRPRFLELFTDPEFMAFGAGALDMEQAHARVDRLIELPNLIPYAKQPVIEKSTGQTVGYTGVDTAVIDGVDRLEWGWRFATEARGQGYATEAAQALLDVADRHSDGEMLCIIAADNAPSHRVAEKLGFTWQRQIIWPSDHVVTDLLTRSIGNGGKPLLAPQHGTTNAG